MKMKPFEEVGKFVMFPRVVLDYIMPICNGAEWKIICAVIRKTIGWGKDSDKLSISQLMSLTGLSNRSIIDTVEHLVEAKYIIKTPSRNTFLYALNKDFEIENYEESSQVENDGNSVLCKKFTENCEESSQKTVKKVHTQYTKENEKINTSFLLKCYEIGGVQKADNAWQVKKLLEWLEQYGEEKVLRILEYYILQDVRFGVAVSRMSGSIANWHDKPKNAAKPGAAFPKLANAEGDENETELPY